MTTRVLAFTTLLAGLAGCAPLGSVTPETSRDPAFDAGSVRPAPLAVVLSAGTLRGFAHIGVLRELRAQGIEPDLIVGSSAGAMVGAIAASGATDAELRAAVDAAGEGGFFDLGSPRRGLLGGSGLHHFVDQHVKRHRIEDFPVRFAAVAVDAERSCLQVFNTGDPGKAAQASSTVPVLLAPPRIAGRQYLDGGLASPLPVDVARALGALKVIAVDVTFEPAERGNFNLYEALWRTPLVTRWAIAHHERAQADFVILPTLPAEASIGMASRHDLMEAGALAVRRDLPAIRAMLLDPPRHPTGAVSAVLAGLACSELGWRR